MRKMNIGHSQVIVYPELKNRSLKILHKNSLKGMQPAPCIEELDRGKQHKKTKPAIAMNIFRI